MSDLDLLVEAAQLGACVDAVRGLGYVPAKEDYSPKEEAHYPPLISPCGTFSIELHTRLFAIHDAGPSPSAMTQRAQGASLGAARVLVPAPAHRLFHLIAHAQIHNRFFAEKRIVLRDMLDMSAFWASHGNRIAGPDALGGFASPREQVAALSFLAAWSALTGHDLPVAITARHRGWAARAIGRLGQPLWQRRLLAAAEMLAMEAARMRTEPGHMARRLGLLDPRRLVRSYGAWRYKLSQKLWA